MTSEDRAKAAWDEACRLYQENDALPYFAKAIRDAENDAYERAAERVETFLSGSAVSVPIAAVIRFLKEQN